MVKTSLFVLCILLVARTAIADPSLVEEQPVTVTFAAEAGQRVDISLRDAVTFGGYFAAVHFQTLCTTPCTTRLPRGRHYLVFEDPGPGIVGGGRYLVDGPTTIAVRKRSRWGTRLGLIIGGGLIAGAGVTELALHAGTDAAGDDAVVAGSLVIGGGLLVALMSVAFPDTLATTQTP